MPRFWKIAKRCTRFCLWPAAYVADVVDTMLTTLAPDLHPWIAEILCIFSGFLIWGGFVVVVVLAEFYAGLEPFNSSPALLELSIHVHLSWSSGVSGIFIAIGLLLLCLLVFLARLAALFISLISLIMYAPISALTCVVFALVYAWRQR